MTFRLLSALSQALQNCCVKFGFRATRVWPFALTARLYAAMASILQLPIIRFPNGRTGYQAIEIGVGKSSDLSSAPCLRLRRCVMDCTSMAGCHLKQFAPIRSFFS